MEYRKLSVDWSALDTLALPELVDTLASSLPFTPEEKQGLVEQVVIKDRLELLTALCELGSVSLAEESSLAH
jgi:Lon protease-like protein